VHFSTVSLLEHIFGDNINTKHLKVLLMAQEPAFAKFSTPLIRDGKSIIPDYKSDNNRMMHRNRLNDEMGITRERQVGKKLIIHPLLRGSTKYAFRNRT